jgi:hypothetical protein
MTDTNTSEPVRYAALSAKMKGGRLPLGVARRWLNVGGCILIAVSAALRATDRGGAVLPVALWASAAASFVAAFIAYMTAP